MKQLLVLWIALVAMSCTSPTKQSAAQSISADSITYAQGFRVERYADYVAVEVRNPWDSTRLLQRYLLVDRNQPLPEGLPKGTVVRTPVRNVAVYTSVHTSIIGQLEESRRIVGVCEPKYIDSPFIQQEIAEGRIANLGSATAPNVERMVEIGTELVIASPFQNGSYGPVEKLGIPIIEGADYMESSPLGRTEWIRFYGLLFGQEARADSIFQTTKTRYLALKERVKGVTHRPTVFVEKRYGSSWHLPGGGSYMANLYHDAGANYLFAHLPGAGSTPLAFETVLEKAIHADFWIMKYNQAVPLTYDGLRAEYTPYEHFDAFKNRKVYGCNTAEVPYYEEVPLHPDYLLEELIHIFHPEKSEQYTPRYFRPLAE